MKIGLLIPIGRTDKYGYQYTKLTRMILENHSNFADHIIIVASSRYVNEELFEDLDNIKFISNEKTLFKQQNGEEIFSFKTLENNVNMGYELLKNRGYDVAIHIHINQYIPLLNFNSLKSQCERMLNKNMPFTWLYKIYQCGHLLFNADKRVPWILNLKGDFKHQIESDSLRLLDKNEYTRIQTGSYKKFNTRAIVDIFGEFTIDDAREKHEFTIKELMILSNSYDPLNTEKLKFNESFWINYMQKKFNEKRISKQSIDELGKLVLKLRKESFISNIIERNYSKS